MRDEHGVHERLDHCNICLRGSNTFRLNVNSTLTGCALCDSPSACDTAAAAADDDDVFLFFLSALLDSAPVATSPKPAADNSQNISYVHRQISASRVRHYVGQAAQSLLISAPTIPSRSRMLPLAVNYDPPAAIKLSFPATTRARSAVVSVAGPTVWNSLPDKLRDPSLSIDSFRRQLKTFLFSD